MDKMVMITYNEAIDAEVMELLGQRELKSYTKIVSTFGSGRASGTHLGNDIWPGKNNILYVACSEKESKELISYVKTLRKKLGKEGVKAFILPIEETT